MTREEVLAVVARHLAASVDGLEAGAIDPMRSMKDYGANSLDIVEVVSGAMRELKVKVPRTELNKLTNLDGLVGLLYDIKSGSQPASAREASSGAGVGPAHRSLGEGGSAA